MSAEQEATIAELLETLLYAEDTLASYLGRQPDYDDDGDTLVKIRAVIAKTKAQRIEELKPADDGEAVMAEQLHYYYKRIAVFVARQLRAAGWLHPKYDKLPALKVVRGPWKAQIVENRNFSWGPTVWDSRKGKYGTVWGRDRFQFRTIEQARGVRNILNLIHKQGLDCNKKDS